MDKGCNAAMPVEDECKPQFRCGATLLIRHELFMNPFGLSLSKPFDKLKANGFLDSVINRAGSIDSIYQQLTK